MFYYVECTMTRLTNVNHAILLEKFGWNSNHNLVLSVRDCVICLFKFETYNVINFGVFSF